MKSVIFYTTKENEEVKLGQVWNQNGQLVGTVNEIFLNDLKDWLERSGEEIEEYLEGLHRRFDGTFLYAGQYQEDGFS